jgi:hypothetical protein
MIKLKKNKPIIKLIIEWFKKSILMKIKKEIKV